MKLQRSAWAGLISLVVVVIFSLTMLGTPETPWQDIKKAPATTSADQIEAGQRIKHIYNLSLSAKTFNADGWLWLKWPENIQQKIETEKSPISQLVELLNPVENNGSSLEPEGNGPRRLPSGQHLQVFRFSGKFLDDYQGLHNFPFEKLELPITVEIRPYQFSMGQDGVTLAPRVSESEVMDDSIELNGYTLKGTRASSFIHDYATVFGEENSKRAGEYSLATFEVVYAANHWAAFYRLIMPWLAVMAILMLAPNIQDNLNDVRLAIPSTGLLTLVFLQQGATSKLPPLSYLTFLDKLNLFGFLAATTEFCMFVWSINLFSTATPSEKGRVVERIQRVGRTYQLAAIAGGFCLLMLGHSSN